MALIAHYRLDGDSLDSIGSNNGTENGVVSWGVGKLGKSAGFSPGTSITLNNSLVTDTQDFSISFWVNPKGTGTYTVYCARKTVGSGLSLFGIGGDIRFDLGNQWSSGVNTPLNEWTHIAVTREGNTKSIFKNGVKAGSQLIGNITGFNPDLASIGQSQVDGTGYANFLDGSLDDLRIYNHALSEREVRDLSLGLISHYRLDGDATDQVGSFSADIGTGKFIDTDEGTVIDVNNTRVFIPLQYLPLKLKGETIVFKQNSKFPRINAGGGGFNNHIIQWGGYHTVNSGGIGLQSGSFSGYIRGPDSSGWTNTISSQQANTIYDIGGVIHYAVVFSDDNKLLVYMNNTLVTNTSLTKPFTGLDNTGISFGTNMQATVSDIRIYANALTPEEVRELYEQRASIDSQGNTHTPMLIETSKQGNILDYTTWTPGTSGNEPGFSTNGSASENFRVKDTGPHGSEITVWEARPDAVSGADGGFNGGLNQIDRTKMHRFSVWIRRPVAGNGTGYFGCSAGGGSVLNRSNNTANGNPYFWSGGLGQEWRLWVGHIWPEGSGIGDIHPDTGIYDNEGNKTATISDFISAQGTTSLGLRQYLFYSTNTDTRQQFCYPRIDVCDGTEPSVLDLALGLDERWENNGFSSNFSVKNGVSTSGLSEIGPASGLVAWYPLMGDTLDYAGDNHGVNNGAVPTSEGYEFDKGVFIDIPDNLDYKEELTAFSWFRSAGVPGSGYHIIMGGSQLELSIPSAGQARAGIHVPSRTVHNHGSGLTDGEWHLVGFTYNGQSKDIFIDGVLVGSDAVSGELSQVPTRRIGVFGTGVNYFANGTIRDVRIYNRALSPEEVLTLYNLTKPDSTKMSITEKTLYTKGQFKEVIA